MLMVVLQHSDSIRRVISKKFSYQLISDIKHLFCTVSDTLLSQFSLFNAK